MVQINNKPENGNKSQLNSANQVITERVPRIIARHKVADEDTLSNIALRYYTNGSRPYWMTIYEANRDEIGGNPQRLKVGTLLVIPELPQELKK